MSTLKGSLSVEETRTSESTADPVCEFYTDHPYPPPVENLDRARDEWQDQNRHRAEFHLFWPNKPYRADLDILVAGCGTWQSAKYALCHPSARVVGVDVSSTSLSATRLLQQKYDLKNLETHQLPLENVDVLDRRFDLVVCTGVLHHLVDPAVGLDSLRRVLKPGGVIYLMVYAPYGRAGIYMIQEYCRRLGIGTSVQEINDLATTIEAMPQQHPLVTLLRGARDAQNTDALADALLNPRDQSYSVPRLLDLVDGSDLKLKRWYWQAPYLPQCGAIAETPHAKKIEAKDTDEQYAALELFRGTMTAHSAIVHQAAEPDQKIGFDTGECEQYVPVRLPHTFCMQERLPPGVAGVLLNRSHPFHDLILPIDAEEKRMFDLIDGKRNIEEILEQSRATLPRAQSFFRKLWWYDQAVFDSS